MHRRGASAIVEADYLLESPDEGPLRFNEFELVPRARETFHQGLGFRPNLELAAAQHMRHTMYNPGEASRAMVAAQYDMPAEGMLMQSS